MRYGVSDATTVEGHGELTRGRESASIAATVAVQDIALLSGGSAG